MPHKIGNKWTWGNIERDTEEELRRTVFWIWQKNGSKGRFSDFCETGKVTGSKEKGDKK